MHSILAENQTADTCPGLRITLVNTIMYVLISGVCLVKNTPVQSTLKHQPEIALVLISARF